MTAPTEAPALTVTIRVRGCPHPYLSSNARINWRAKARVTRYAREGAKAATLDLMRDMGFTRIDTSILPRLSVVIAWGYNRKRIDPTNLWATCKPFIDGMADALQIDDKHFVPGDISQVRAPKDDPFGYVELTLTPA